MLSVALATFAFCASASAENGETSDVYGGVTVGEAEGTAEDGEAAVGEAVVGETESDSEKGNPFAELYDMALGNADKIFSALAFIGTLLLAFAYKKGLLPTVSRAISSIAAITKAAKDETDKSIAEGDVRLTEVSAGLERTVEILAAAENGISRIEERLATVEKSDAQSAALKTVLSSQIDMLYDIFMASSIPEYQKEAVGRRVAEMRKELSADECGNKK